MAEVIPLPKLSDTMEEGVVATWTKKLGDKVREGDLLCEIETDKATMDYEAPSDGELIAILLPAGEKAKIGTPICVLGAAGEKYTADSPTSKQSAQAIPATQNSIQNSKAVSPKESAVPSAQILSSGGGHKSSPLARKLAKEQGIEIANLQGSGPLGRVVARDVVKGGESSARSSVQPGVHADRADTILKNSMMRQTIAKRLTASKNDAPHFYLSRTVLMTEAMSLREEINDKAAQQKSPMKISVNDLVVMAVSRALTHHPLVNASWAGDHIISRGAINVAIAVALPDGLITPVITHADQKTLTQISQETKALAERAKTGTLKPEEYTTGTFTISNLGMFGIEEFTAIINAPQAAILAVGATEVRPWVNKKGKVKAADQMKITLSCDHRVIDGATGARFLTTVVENLENPAMMLV